MRPAEGYINPCTPNRFFSVNSHHPPTVTRMRRLLYCLFVIPAIVFAQQQPTPDAAHIKAQLKKLNVLGSVLYVAAHPDDENTRIITYMANDRQVETAYL